MELIESLERQLAELKATLPMTTATATKSEYITITDAAERFEPDHEKRQQMRFRIQNWVTRGRLLNTSRGKGPGPGGVVLVDAREVEALLNDPPRTGVHKAR